MSPNERRIRADIIRRDNSLHGKEVCGPYERIADTIRANNIDERGLELALRWTKNALKFTERAGLSLGEVQDERSFVYFSGVPSYIDLYLNLHDGRLYAREKDGSSSNPYPISSYEELSGVLNVNKDF